MRGSHAYFDANFAINQHRGMGKFINNFVDALQKNEGLHIQGLLAPNAKAVGDFKKFGFANYMLWEQISLPYFIHNKRGMAIFPYNTAPLSLRNSHNNVLILHDLIYMHSFKTASLKQKLGAAYRKFIVPRIVHNFEHIITVSEYSKKECVETFDLNPAKIVVIPNAIEFDEGEISSNPSPKDRQRYVLHIGGEPQYKNSKAVLYAFSALPTSLKADLKLKIIGIRNSNSRNEFLNLAKELDIVNQLELLPYQTDSEIRQLYRHAKMLIFPSFFEGFGIPIIESFKYGCPLLCSNSSCFPEIAADAATYFDPVDPHSIATAMLYVMENEDETRLKVQKGYQQLKNYSLAEFEKKVSWWYNTYFLKAI